MPSFSDPETQTQLQSFEKTQIGVAFIKIFGEDLNTYMQSKMGEVEATVKSEYQKLLGPAEIDKLFVQFVAENFKKQ